MRIKLVAIAGPEIEEALYSSDARIRQRSTYREVVLFHEKGAYGVPEIVGIRYPPEREEKAVAVHYGHDIRNQEEEILEQDNKDSLIYKYEKLGFKNVGEFEVRDIRFGWREFEGKLICIKEIGACFISIYREFPGHDTDIFAEKQRRAWGFLSSLGIKKEQLLSVDYWGVIVLQTLQQGSEDTSTPQS